MPWREELEGARDDGPAEQRVGVTPPDALEFCGVVEQLAVIDGLRCL